MNQPFQELQCNKYSNNIDIIYKNQYTFKTLPSNYNVDTPSYVKIVLF